MALSENQALSLKALLLKSVRFRRAVGELTTKPFVEQQTQKRSEEKILSGTEKITAHNPGEDPSKVTLEDLETSDLISLQQVRQARILWGTGILILLAIAAIVYLLTVALRLLPSDSIGEFVKALKDASMKVLTPGAKQGEARIPISSLEWTIVFLILTAGYGVLCYTFLRSPLHMIDPVFGRLLRTKFDESKPISRHRVFTILSDVRFDAILQRAMDRTFPVNISDHGVESSATPGWTVFVDRLVGKLAADDAFSDLVVSRFGENALDSAPTLVIDCAVWRSLRYKVREILLRTVIDDPDFSTIYDGSGERFRRVAEWLPKFDVTKAAELLGKRGNKPGKSGGDIQGVANVVLIVILVMALGGMVVRASGDKTIDAQRYMNQMFELLHDHERNIVALAAQHESTYKPPIMTNTCPPSPPPVIMQAPSAIISVPPKVNLELSAPQFHIPTSLSLELNSSPVNPPTLAVNVTSSATRPCCSPDKPSKQSEGTSNKDQKTKAQDTLMTLEIPTGTAEKSGTRSGGYGKPAQDPNAALAGSSIQGVIQKA
ncbi:MAG TPA: hypothetical protein VGD64_15200, partial [Acidisarcina sp.]